MKKYYCDHCGKEIDSKHITRLGLVRPDESVLSGDTFHFCDKCREEFFGWLNNKPAKQEGKEADKPADKPAKKSAKKSPYTVAFISLLANAPESTVRRHMEGICSTYGKDKQGRTVRYYHLSDEQRDTIIERIKNRKQGSRTKI